MADNGYNQPGIYRLNKDLALVQSLSLSLPMLDNAYLFGQIAAAHAFNSIYALGAKPLMAQNIAAFPQAKDKSLFKMILEGAALKIKEANALLTGGYTLDDKEPKYGLSLTATVHPDHLIAPNAAQEGDLLFLSKPLGSGILANGLRKGQLGDDDAEQALATIATLSKQVAEIMADLKIKAAIDIGQNGLLGHGYQLALSSGLAMELWAALIPAYPQAIDLLNRDIISDNIYHNLKALHGKVHFDEQINDINKALLADPQLSGGLLIAAPKLKASKLEVQLEKAGLEFAIIGKMRAGKGLKVIAN